MYDNIGEVIGVSNLSLPLSTALEGHEELRREIGTLTTKEQVAKLASDVDVIKAAVSIHSGEIRELKKAQ